MHKNKFRLLAVISGLAGAGILLWVVFPIISYQISSPDLMTFLSPMPDTSSQVDYTKASSFFPEAKAKEATSKPAISFYKLSIPRLGIKDATVSIGGEDLAESLIQYPGTALPGQIGDAVVFGHSVLPAFYDPTSYITIFSTLPTLGQGDTINVSYDGITYKYQVEEKFEVDPTDIEILNQDESDSYLTLVTCVPPGLQTRRLIVKARIVPVRSN